MKNTNGYVWTEKYRPDNLHNIVLDPFNKQILQNIVNTEYFPNLLLYGPPGTGKTTTIINLINAYQEKTKTINKDLIIHLNASDERGIDIIRSQISTFVNTKPLFNKGIKFVILDEVDYMTKTAQQALRYLLQNYNNNVRFCLICNYISKIDEGLQDEFIRLRFNQLPKNDVIQFIQNISETEHLNFSLDVLAKIQNLYRSDIRSIINFMQSNQHLPGNLLNIIDDTVWEKLYTMITSSVKNDIVYNFINSISNTYNIDKKNIVKYFLNYIINNKQHMLNSKLLNVIENILHSQITNNNILIKYMVNKFKDILVII